MVKKIILLSLFGFASFNVFAEIPVVDYSSDSNSQKAPVPVVNTKPSIETISSGLTADQRMNRLEQQVNNLNQQNLISKIEELQQRIQKLNGQVEDQAHQIEQFNTQLRNFYQDLNQRLDKPKTSEPVPATTTPTNKPKVVEEKPKVVESHPAVVDPVKSSTEGSVIVGEIVEVPPLDTGTKKDEPVKSTDAAFLQEQQKYHNALDYLPDKKEEGGRRLREYLKAYPKGIYAADAHYWLGEINFSQKNYDAAEEELKMVTEKYAKSRRVPDAMFKLALVHQNQGRETQAKNELKLILKRYPGTAVAKNAKLQLEGNS